MAEPQKKTKLVGFSNFKRSNPKTDRFEVHSFDHIEFYCGDALNCASRFSWGLGMHLVAQSGQATGNHVYASQAIRSGDTTFVFTAPYSRKAKDHATNPKAPPHPGYDAEYGMEFLQKHGFAARAIAIRVSDAFEAYQKSVDNGAKGVLKPVTLSDDKGELVMSEISLYGDVVLRFIQRQKYSGAFLPGYENVDVHPTTYGIERIDHCVGNVPNLLDAVNYLMAATGFHEFAEFTSEDVGTVDSGLNSMVLSSNNEMVLLPINEPTFGTKRKSQIQTYLDQNEGPGLQHIALKTNDIFKLAEEVTKRATIGGFSFMPRPSDDYYKKLPSRIGNVLSEEQYKLVEKYGLLVDQDDQGTLVQVFTKPLGDRPTIFVELIQRIGCEYKNEKGEMDQRGGCGGFGKGNFSELFKSIEDYERTLDA